MVELPGRRNIRVLTSSLSVREMPSRNPPPVRNPGRKWPLPRDDVDPPRADVVDVVDPLLPVMPELMPSTWLDMPVERGRVTKV